MKIVNQLTQSHLAIKELTMYIQKDSVNFPEELELFRHKKCTEDTHGNIYKVVINTQTIIGFCELNCNRYSIPELSAKKMFRTRLEIKIACPDETTWNKIKKKYFHEPLTRKEEIYEALYNFINLISVSKTCL